MNIIRYNDWWSFKTPTLLAIFYATIYIYGNCIFDSRLQLIKLLLYISSAAIYVCVINDITDRKIDLLASKSNLFLKLTELQTNIILISTILLQVFVLYLLKNHGYSAYWYLLSIIAYSLYSIPPFRLKERKTFGVFADALGAHCFASIFIVTYAYSIINVNPDIYWVSAIFIWSLSYGLRGIIWHQVMDKEASASAGLKTVAHLFSLRYLKRITFFSSW